MGEVVPVDFGVRWASAGPIETTDGTVRPIWGPRGALRIMRRSLMRPQDTYNSTKRACLAAISNQTPVETARQSFVCFCRAVDLLAYDDLEGVC